MPDSPTPAPDIICHATKWYLWRRVVPFSILPLALAAFFFYDWKVGYPEKMTEYQAFQKYKEEGKSQEWVSYSASQGWDKEPEEMHQGKIDEQLYWGIGVGLLGLWSLGYYLLSYPKKLTADATSFTPPWGSRIAFSSVYRLDKRPWKLKGLATVFYKIGEKSKKTALDDLRFAGADKILARLEANFTGEILDLEEEAPPAQPTDIEAP